MWRINYKRLGLQDVLIMAGMNVVSYHEVILSEAN